MATTSEAFQTAFAHHQAGRLLAAEALYRQILESDANHVDALHLLGLVAYQSGRHADAEPLIARAVQLDGSRALFHANLGEVYRAQEKLPEAARSLRRALEIDARLPTALNSLGIVLGAQGQANAAKEAFRQAIGLRPGFAEAHNNLGTVLHAQGELDEAVANYRRAIEINPNYADAYNNLGTALKTQGLLDGAADAYRQALRLAPSNGDVHVNLGTVYQSQGQLDEAVGCYRHALVLDPRSAIAHSNSGAALAEKSLPDEAIASCRDALAIDPELADAHVNLGSAYLAKHDRAAAAEAFRQAVRCDGAHAKALTNLGKLLEDEGRLDEALEFCDRAVAADPKSGAAHSQRANVCKALGRARDAVDSYRKSIEVQPQNPEAYNNLAIVYNDLAQPDLAVDCCRKGLEYAPNNAALYANMGTGLGFQGRLSLALAASRKAVSLLPESPGAFSNLLYGLNFLPDYDPATHFEEHLEWARRHAEPLSATAAPHANDRSPQRRLRVGYVSSFFREHAVNFFSEPLISAHDHEQFEIFCYSDVTVPDDATRRLQSAADHWRNVRYDSDEKLADLVRADAIDILVDLAGHIGGGRLLAFARKPAPVQVTYIGYQNTTGMSAMNYRLTDERADPPGETDQYYTEKLVRLPRSFFCYRPADNVPDVTPLPARQSGRVTFASFNNYTKVSGRTLRAWLEILLKVEGSRLMVLANRQGFAERHFKELAAVARIDPGRIEFFDKLPRAGYYRLVQQADIALDPFPFNGHTTSCDAIWLGVPVVMLQGRMYASRFGSSVLANVGLDDLITRSVDEYIAAAANLACDLPRLEELRTQLRPRMAASALLDFKGFTRNVEAAYRQMWIDWCRQSPGEGR